MDFVYPGICCIYGYGYDMRSAENCTILHQAPDDMSCAKSYATATHRIEIPTPISPQHPPLSQTNTPPINPQATAPAPQPPHAATSPPPIEVHYQKLTIAHSQPTRNMTLGGKSSVGDPTSSLPHCPATPSPPNSRSPNNFHCQFPRPSQFRDSRGYRPSIRRKHGRGHWHSRHCRRR